MELRKASREIDASKAVVKRNVGRLQEKADADTSSENKHTRVVLLINMVERRRSGKFCSWGVQILIINY